MGVIFGYLFFVALIVSIAGVKKQIHDGSQKNVDRIQGRRASDRSKRARQRNNSLEAFFSGAMELKDEIRRELLQQQNTEKFNQQLHRTDIQTKSPLIEPETHETGKRIQEPLEVDFVDISETGIGKKKGKNQNVNSSKKRTRLQKAIIYSEVIGKPKSLC